MNNQEIIEVFEDYNKACNILGKIMKEITIKEDHNMTYGLIETTITIPVKYIRGNGVYSRHHVVSDMDKGLILHERTDGWKNYKGLSLEEFLELPDYSGEPKIERRKLS